MRTESLRFNFEFSRVYRYGKFSVGRCLSVHVFKRRPGTKQSGYTVDPSVRRTGFCANKRGLGAVGRNRIRRLMREAYRTVESGLPGGYDYVFTYKSGKSLPVFEEVRADMEKCCRRLKLL